jgi:signal transduction histidine kinase
VLADFLTSYRDAIIARTQARVAARPSPRPTAEELANGIPVFLEQLGLALEQARASTAVDHDQIDKSASRHGNALFHLGLTVGQVVHDYGDVCQVVTELAIEKEVPISGEEFRTLNLCLDDAIAGAVTEHSRQRELAIADLGTERLGVLAHEMRNLLNTAMLSFESIKTGRVASGGSTALVLGRSLMRLQDLIDRSLAAVRLEAGIEHLERIAVADFFDEIEIGGRMQAEARGLHFTVGSVDRTLTIDGDRQVLAGAISNLLQNAFKFTRKNGMVTLTARTTPGRVLMEVEDECGGLPTGKTEELFRPFEQRGTNRTGVGLGLAICRKAAKANGGEIRVRDIPGKGCVFSLDMPRKPPPPLSAIDGGKGKANSQGAAGGQDAQKTGTPRKPRAV